MSKLKTEQNTQQVERLVREAARERFGLGGKRAVFEHGQWWLIVDGDERTQTFSVVDASPGIGTTGLDFEEV